MKLPRAAWWLIAPASWVWQYVVYVPVYVLLNLAIAVIHVFGMYPVRPFSARRRIKFDTRPWFIDRLR